MVSKRAIEAELRAAQKAVEKERAAAEKLNLADVCEFAFQRSIELQVDAWLKEQTRRLEVDASERRSRRKVAAGRALAALKARGLKVAEIAALVGVSSVVVQEYLSAAALAEPLPVAIPVAVEAAADVMSFAEDGGHVVAEIAVEQQ